MKLNGKKLFLIGFVVVLLVGIPLTVYLLQQQQEVRSRAEKSTNITFTPDSSQTAPIQAKVDDVIALDINVDPGKNLVSFVKLEIQYDPEKLATTSANAFQPNTLAFPSVLEGPIYTPGKIAVTLSVGPDPTKAIQQAVKAATLNFKAVANTPAGTPTLVTYGATTQVLSAGPNDQYSENVLSSATPATIVIGDGGDIPTGSPTPTVEVSPTVETPTTEPTAQPTTQPGPTTANSAPVCNSLVLDRAESGNAPYSLTFTVQGTDADDTISKVTFNFGDGQVSDVTTGGGIGTNTVNAAQISHTYNNAGTFQASAILTDSANAVSGPGNCTKTITVTASDSAAPANPVQTDPAPQSSSAATPTMEPTGVFDTTLGIGAVVMFLIIGGGLLFFIF